MTDWVGLERRLQREADEPYLELLREVQRNQQEQLSKLTDAQAELAKTVAVHANILQTLATATAAQGGLNVQNVADHAGLKAGVRLLSWGVPILLTIASLMVALTVYVTRLGPP